LVQDHSCEPYAVLDYDSQTRGRFSDVIPRQSDGGDDGSDNDEGRGKAVAYLPLALLVGDLSFHFPDCESIGEIKAKISRNL
jgi:hypothetical protein